jgi:hypothetical protein
VFWREWRLGRSLSREWRTPDEFEERGEMRNLRMGLYSNTSNQTCGTRNP